MQFTPWEILIAWIPNTDGTRPSYAHPCIYLGESPKFPGRILVLGVTSDLSQRRADYSVDLPWAVGGDKETGLDRPSIAQALWTNHIMPAEVRRVIGLTPQAQRLQIARALALRIGKERPRKP